MAFRTCGQCGLQDSPIVAVGVDEERKEHEICSDCVQARRYGPGDDWVVYPLCCGRCRSVNKHFVPYCETCGDDIGPTTHPSTSSH